MKKKLFTSIVLSGIVLFSSVGLVLAQEMSCTSCHITEPIGNKSFHKMSGISEKAVGVMDKGQLANNTGNFGDLANFLSWWTNAGHWPRSGASTRQYFFGLGLLVGINEHNVIETSTQAATKILDWLPPDDARGKFYSGDVKAVSDDTPFQASSDLEETWPYGYYSNGNWVEDEDERHWPGHYKIDTNHPDYPNTLVEYEGRFTSDRDVYSLYNDDNNTRGKVGITVEQTGYSYGRPYAEDFIFFELKIHNTSAANLDSVYVGLYSKFRPDFDDHDYVHFEDSDGDGQKDLIIIYDVNNYANRAWALTSSEDPMGMVGLRIYDTPYDLGVTDFHHHAKAYSPKLDEEFWAIMTSDKNNPVINDSLYFHGENRRIDDTSEEHRGEYYPASENEDTSPVFYQMEEGAGVNTVVSVGPFTLNADSTVVLSFGLIMGDSGKELNNPDFTDLMKNVQSANEMYRNHFLGYTAPDAPVLSVVPEDGGALLYWSAYPSEFSKDDATGQYDFEGYKIFRSTDKGLTWGDPITDMEGEIIGFKPLAIYDVIDGVKGLDPAYPQNLGRESGLQHYYRDENLVNGMEYWYCVTAYDKGSQNPNNIIQSFMYPIGSSTFEPHLVSVVPGTSANTLIEASVPENDLSPTNGSATGTVKVKLVNPEMINGDSYTLTINHFMVDTVNTQGIILVNSSNGDTLLQNQALNDESGDNIPVTEGFRLYVKDTATEDGFTDGLTYTFSTTARSYAVFNGNSLSELRVVPDPYIVSSSLETSEFGKKLKFNHLPDQCTIRIFTLAGDFIAKVEHESPSGYEFWDMRTKNDQFLAAGVYLYYATTPDGDVKKGRFLVIR